jgi:hypothetical protein
VDVRRRDRRSPLLGRPAAVDPEVAAATFRRHLDQLWASGKPEERGWRREQLDPLHELITMPARLDGAPDDEYFVELGAVYYDYWPPTTAFIDPASGAEATKGTRWWPKIEGAPEFGFDIATFDAVYKTRLGTPRQQLVCFTGTAQYYMVDHNPPEHTVWNQGSQTMARTLARLHELLGPPFYKGPSG